MDILKECQENYGIPFNNIESLSGGWLNTKYILKSNENPYVLKQVSSNKFSRDYIETIILNSLKLQKFLNESGIVCPNVIESKNGLMPVFSNQEYFFLMDYVSGEEKDYRTILPCEMKSLGYHTGLMHTKMAQFTDFDFKDSFLHLKYENELQTDLIQRKRDITECTPKSFKTDIESHSEIINDLKTSRLLEKQKQQIIHGDYTYDNIRFFNQQVAGIFDLELTRHNSKLQDIGRILLSNAFDGDNFDFEKTRAFIEGYNLISNLTTDDVVSTMKVVWSNEVDLWIKERYYRNYNPPKVVKFMTELNWITKNWFKLDNYFKGGLEQNEKRKSYQRK